MIEGDENIKSIESGSPQVLPFYIVCDEGVSMAGESIQAANVVTGAIFKSLSSDPIVDAKARVSIIAFSDSAEVILPLSQLSTVTGVPSCSAHGSSSYSAAFRKTKEQIDSDVAALKEQNLRVLRPVVFFISDGQPNSESWLSEHASLTDPAYENRPHIISYGVAGARADVISAVATPLRHFAGHKVGYLAADSSDPSGTIRELLGLSIYVPTIVTSDSVAPAISPDSTIYVNLDWSLEDIGELNESMTRKGEVGMSTTTNLGSEAVDSTGGIDSGGTQVLPFYIVCDESGSMAGDSIQAVNDGIAALFRALSSDPIVDAKARVSIIAFSDTADVILPLTQISSVNTGVPGCSVRGSTSYLAAFRKTKEQLDVDVVGLKAQGFRVLRPVVFFISDGAPNNEPWQSELASLTDPSYKYRPHIISFGVAGAQADVIREVATPVDRAGQKKFAWKADDGTNPGPALTEIFKFITGTVVTSAGADQPTIVEMDIPGVMKLDVI